MKHTFHSIALIALLMFGSLVAGAQNNQQLGCVDGIIRQQGLEMKQQYLQTGFAVVRDGMLNMSSDQPLPIVINLKKGVFYQIIFIGNTRATKLTLETFDGKDKRIDSRSSVIKEGNMNNYISLSFTPDKTDMYMFILHQKMKRKNFCANFMILELKQDKDAVGTAPRN